MILLDTSAWIRFFHKGNLSFEDLKSVVTCGPVIQEVLQGIRHPGHWRTAHDGLTALPTLCDPLPASIFIEASEIFRIGRSKGCTIRSTVDCLIAAIAIETDSPVAHFDRDFDAIARFTKLRTVRFPI